MSPLHMEQTPQSNYVGLYCATLYVEEASTTWAYSN